jgi:hypothetical protein
LHPHPEIHKTLCSKTVAATPIPPCLHIACTDFALRELVACWHRLAADVRERIIELARRGDPARSTPANTAGR